MTNLCTCRDYINAGFGFVALAAVIENFPFHGRVASAFTLAAAHILAACCNLPEVNILAVKYRFGMLMPEGIKQYFPAYAFGEIGVYGYFLTVYIGV